MHTQRNTLSTISALVMAAVAAVYSFSPPAGNGAFVVLVLAAIAVGFALRETEPLSFKRPELLLLAAVLLGGSLRLYGLTFGFPDFYHPDELRKASHISKMIERGSLNPKYFLHPTLLLYLSYANSKLLSLMGIFEGDRLTRLVLAGRLVSAFFGTASIAAIYFLGREAHSRTSGAISAALLAVYPLHVTSSRYMKEDVLLVFFLLLSLVFALRAARTWRVTDILLCGLWAGFAAGSKYSGVLAFLFLILPLLGRPKVTIKTVILVACAAALGALAFLACVPFALHEFDLFIGDAAWEARHARIGHLGVSIPAASELWMFHIRRSLIPGTGFVSMLLALSGIAFLLRSRKMPHRVIVLCLLLFWAIAEASPSKPFPQPDRYVLPCLPFVALASAFLITNAGSKLGRVFFVLTFIAPLTYTVLLASEIPLDTRKQAKAWISDNLPPQTKILTMGGGGVLPALDKRRFKVGPARRVIGDYRRGAVDPLRRSSAQYLLRSTYSHPRFDGIETQAKLEALEQIDSAFKLVYRAAPRFESYGFHNPTVSLYAVK